MAWLSQLGANAMSMLKAYKPINALLDRDYALRASDTGPSEANDSFSGNAAIAEESLITASDLEPVRSRDTATSDPVSAQLSSAVASGESPVPCAEAVASGVEPAQMPSAASGDPEQAEMSSTASDDSEPAAQSAEAATDDPGAAGASEAAASNVFISDIPLVESTTFDSREAAEEHLMAFALANGFAIRLKSSGHRRVYLECCRSRSYVSQKTVDPTKLRRNKGSRSCDCPCKIMIELPRKRDAENGVTAVTVSGSMSAHNHNKDPVTAYPANRKISDAVGSRINALSRLGMKAPQIIMSLKAENAELTLLPRDVSNCMHRVKREARQNGGPVKAVLERLSSENWPHCALVQDEGSVDPSVSNHRLEALLVLNPLGAQQLAKAPQVIMLDCTYKTNKYDMPLLHCVGRNGCGRTFTVALVWLPNEKEDMYRWALENLQALLPEISPKIVVTDREEALARAIRAVYPSAVHFLCRWHLNQNVLDHALKCVKPDHRPMYGLTMELFDSPSLEIYETRLSNLRKHGEKFPTYVRYLDGVLKDKAKFVKYAVDQHMHYGSTSTSRLEGAHSKLKQYLTASNAEIDVAVQNAMTYFKEQHRANKAVTELQQTTQYPDFNSNVYQDVTYRVSAAALKLAKAQLGMAILLLRDEDRDACSCSFTRVNGIPCAHALRDLLLSNRKLQRADFDEHWWLENCAGEATDVVRYLPPLQVRGKGRPKGSLKRAAVDDDAMESSLAAAAGGPPSARSREDEQAMQDEGTQGGEAREANGERSRGAIDLQRAFRDTLRASAGSNLENLLAKSGLLAPTDRFRRDISSRRDPTRLEHLVSTKKKCSNCKAIGHNVRSCPHPPTGGPSADK